MRLLRSQWRIELYSTWIVTLISCNESSWSQSRDHLSMSSSDTDTHILYLCHWYFFAIASNEFFKIPSDNSLISNLLYKSPEHESLCRDASLGSLGIITSCPLGTFLSGWRHLALQKKALCSRCVEIWCWAECDMAHLGFVKFNILF